MASAATIEKRKQRHATALARGTEGFVPTPEDISWHITGFPYSNLWALPPGATVLEPSAGDNALVRVILEQNRDVHVTAVEPNAERAAENRPQVKDEWGYPTEYKVDYVPSTFEDFADANKGRTFDAVVMNPPWVLVGQSAAWLEHVLLAWSMLAPGGRLVAIVPSGFRHRNGQRFAALRELVAATGGVERLPDVKVKGWPSTDVIWMVKPLLFVTPTHLVPTYTGDEWRSRVSRPNFSGLAAMHMPVQLWEDRWRDRDRVLRYAGQCVTPTCRHLTWAFDDGENDPRGVLGDAAASPLHAADYDMTGPSVALCFYCANDGDSVVWDYSRYERRQVLVPGAYTTALAVAMKLWTPRPVQPEPVLKPADDGGLFTL